MKSILLGIALFFSLHCCASEQQRGVFEARRIGNDIQENGLPRLADYVFDMVNIELQVAAVNLTDKGFGADAEDIQSEWVSTYRDTFKNRLLSRDIGDHKPLFQWLSNVYNKIEGDLGLELCKELHISNLKSLNFGLPVVFEPCSFPMDLVVIPREYEYQDHFARGQIYEGTFPVVVYWAITIPCWTGTSGLGAFVCSLAANAAERFAANTIGPALSNRIFTGACGPNAIEYDEATR